MSDAVTDVIAWARAAGFEHVAPLDADTLESRPDVRAACVRNLCDHYGWTKACPPGCGEVHSHARRLRTYARGVLVQTSLPLARDAGLAELLATSREHGRRLRGLVEVLAERLPDVWVLGGGDCESCAACTLPDDCAVPEVHILSMEAAGLNVAEVCERNGLPLDHGDGTLTWVGCVLVD